METDLTTPTKTSLIIQTNQNLKGLKKNKQLFILINNPHGINYR